MSDKIGVVTGASGGIGAATVRRLASAGASVVAVDVDVEGLRDLDDYCRDSGGRVETLVADVATAQGNLTAVELAQSLGGLDFFHANAAVQRMGSLEDTTEADWDALHNVNLRGVYLGAKSAIPAIRARGGGAIVITASVLGLVADGDLAAYGAMKGGVRSLCRGIAVSNGKDNIRCNTICPGDVRTQMLDDFFNSFEQPDEARALLLDRYPLRRFAEPLDVANVVAFLVSDEAAYITGTDVVVDGGLLARVY